MQDTEIAEWGVLRDPYQIFLDHQIRLWEAEEENSRRMGTRLGILLTASFGFIGVVLFRFGLASFDVQVARGPAEVLLWTAVALLAVGLICLAGSCLFLLRSSKAPREEPASLLLQLAAKDIEGFQARLGFLVTEGAVEPSECWNLARQQLLIQANHYYAAVEEMRIRNTEEEQRIDRAQRWFLPGVAGTMFALLVWTCASLLTSTAETAVSTPSSGQQLEGEYDANATEPTLGEAGVVEPDERRGEASSSGRDPLRDEGVGRGEQQLQQGEAAPER